MLYLVIDFETTGVGKDAKNGYKNYPAALAPLPRPNYPVELAAELIDANGTVVDSMKTLISGAERLDPWVLENCPHLSVKTCERDGIPLIEAIGKLVDPDSFC